MIIDFHAHIYPEKIAEKATKSISSFYENTPMAWNGRCQELIESGKKIGVVKYIVHSTATKAEQVESINNFIIGECQKYPEFVGFGTMHPDYENFEQELERIHNAGLKGIKLHPDFQRFECDTPKMDDVYTKMAQLKMPVLFHAGDARYDFSGPKRILHVLEKHPDLIIIAAHFGGYTEWENSIKYLVGKNVYFDTSKLENYYVFGNHDDETMPTLTKEQMLDGYMSYAGCLAYDADPALHGCATHNLEILSSDGTHTAFNLWLMDDGEVVVRGADSETSGGGAASILPYYLKLWLINVKKGIRIQH